MEVPVTFLDKSSKKTSLILLKELAIGKIAVYKVCCLSRRAVYILKVFPKHSLGNFLYEKEKLLSRLSHPNIVHYIPMIMHKRDCNAILTEYLKNGDFFDLITAGALSNVILVRTYFHKLIKAIEYMHSQGIAHLDLKLENFMLDSDFNLKIIDFDHAQLIKDECVTSGGTINYRAPEVKNYECVDLAAADVFSAGVILYIFRAKEFPFMEEDDPEGKDLNRYSTYLKNRKDFWEMKIKKKGYQYFSEDFIELVDGMVTKDQLKRLTIKEIKETKWYKGPVFNDERLKTEMKLRKESKFRKSFDTEDLRGKSKG